MRFVRVSNTAWRVFISIMAALAVVLLAGELYYSIEPMSRGARGTLGVHFSPPGEKRFVMSISQIDAASPLAALGARNGDTVILDRRADDRRNYLLDEPIGLTLIHANLSRHVFLKPMVVPISPGYAFQYYSETIARALAILFGLLIAFKQSESRVYRALALYFLCNAFNGLPAFSPPGTLRYVADQMYWGTAFLTLYFPALFAVHYPDGRPTGLRARLARLLPAMGLLTFSASLYLLWWANGYAAPQEYFLTMTLGFVETLITLLALWDGWRSSTGAHRQRQSWLLVSIGTAIFFSVPTGLPIHTQIAGARVTLLLSDSASVLMEIGIAYAVLKHRIFDFGFALNRAIFYSATSLILLVAFGIVEWLSEHLLHFEAREANVLIDGAIALGVYLAFHKIRHVFEHGLERLFFHHWHENEARLRQFVKRAAYIATTEALLRDFQAELKRFSGGSSCSIFQKDGQGNYALLDSTEPTSPGSIDVDDVISVRLRAERRPFVVDAAHPFHGHNLALPMTHRGELHAYVLLGTKPGKGEYRPDEIAVLAFAVDRIGLDLHALKVEKLIAQLSSHEKRAELDATLIQEQRTELERFHRAYADAVRANLQITGTATL